MSRSQKPGRTVPVDERFRASRLAVRSSEGIPAVLSRRTGRDWAAWSCPLSVVIADLGMSDSA